MTPMRRPLIALGLVVLGLGFLGAAGYVWVDNDLAHYGQATYAIAAPEGADFEPQPTVPDDATVVAYEDLPSTAQAAFEAALEGEGRVLWEQDDQRAVAALSPHSGGYIRYRGEYYEFLLLVGHRGASYWQRGLLTFLGALGAGIALIGLGGRELRSARSPA